MKPNLHPLAAAVALAAAFGALGTGCSRTDVPATPVATTTITTTAPATITTNTPVTTVTPQATASAPADTASTTTPSTTTDSASTATTAPVVTTAPSTDTIATTTAPVTTSSTTTTTPAPTTTPMAANTTTSAPGTTLGTKVDDTVITTKVKAALVKDQQIQALQIKVETRKGQVQLSGFADNQGQIDRAMTVAKGIEGVTGVDNAMSLKQGARTVGNKVDDGIVTAKVKSALLADSSVKALDIAVATNKGEVQLSGFVDNQAQIDQAIAVAKGVEGVQGVANKMTLKK